MDVSRPYLLLCSKVDGATLQVLRRTTAPLTGREVAGLVREGSQPAIQAALTRFAEHGLVTAMPAGKAILYTLNREHLAMPAVDWLLGMREALVERIKECLGEWEPAPLHASLFGSVARGDGTTQSDVDLLLVRPDGTSLEDRAWRLKLADLERAIERWSGNRASPIDIGLDDLRAMLNTPRQLLGDVDRDGILIMGSSLRQLVPAAPRARAKKRTAA